MDIFSNTYLVQNIALAGSLIFVSFLLAHFLTPIAGMLARKLGAVDLPARLRKRGERGLDTRIHAYPYPKLGGLAVAASFLIVLIGNNMLGNLPTGVIIGILIIIVLGFLDDVFEISAPVQFALQFLAAFAVVASGISITSINVLNIPISFDWLPDIIIQIGGYAYNFVFPGDVLTILWIIGLINVINWVGGVDALNASVSSIALGTMLILILSLGNIPLAMVIAVYLGSVLGVLPFNWNPGKIMYGSIGDYLNGFLLAVFAIIGGAKWNATLIVLALPIIDGLYVFYSRWKANPQLRSKPFQLMNLSGYNHLHHRILSAGYSKKMVVLIEGTIMFVICTIVLYFSGINQEYIAIPVALMIILIIFTFITFRVKKAQKEKNLKYAAQLAEEEKMGSVVVQVVGKEEDDEDQKFVY